jgi:hypothetical protein
MSLLRDFERHLESVVEGAFAKTFRSGLQPVELAKRVLRDMEAGRSVGVGGQTWVPNHYAFTLSSSDRERFAGAEGALRNELAQVVRRGARDRSWGLMGPPQIVFSTDERLKKGSFGCTASIVQGVETGEGMPEARLELIVDGRRGQSYRVAPGLTVIGRQQGCQVVLTDAAASRRHAQVANDNGVFTLTDLGSTNGTLVNGARATSVVLQPGDRITIGATTLELRAD